MRVKKKKKRRKNNRWIDKESGERDNYWSELHLMVMFMKYHPFK